MELLFFVIAASLFMFTVFVGVLRCAYANRLTVEKRLAVFERKEQKDEIRRRVRDSRRRMPIKISQLLRDQLTSAGIPMRAEEFMGAWVLLALLPSMGAALLGARFFVCMLLALIGLVLPPLYVKHSRGKRVRAFEAQLADAVTSMSNCLKSGLTFQQGMLSIADQMPEPVAGEFGRTIREVQLGNTMEAALNNFTRRMPSPDLKLMVTAILISQQVGGSLSEVMDSIAQTIYDRIRVKNDVRTLTSQGRMSGFVIGGLPIAIALILSVINPGYMDFFFKEEVGKILLGVAVGMETFGFLVIRKIITVKY